MAEECWNICVCPVHGGRVSESHPCRVVVKRTGTTVTYCHQAEPVKVVPADALEAAESRCKGLEETLKEIASTGRGMPLDQFDTNAANMIRAARTALADEITKEVGNG